MKRRRYTLEFKEASVRQLILDGNPAVDLADKLGLNTGLLYRWKQGLIRAGKIKSVQSQGVDLSEVVAKNARLRKELNRAREINAVLKKRWATFRRTRKEICLYERKPPSTYFRGDVRSSASDSQGVSYLEQSLRE